MRIIVNNKLTYSCTQPVQIGDTVELPDTGWMGGNWSGKVTALESNYTGYCKSVIRVIPATLDKP